MRRYLRIFYLALGLLIIFRTIDSQTGSSIEQIRKRGLLLWGSDAEGEAPYVFLDPKNPSRLIGFEADIAGRIAGEVGVSARQTQNAWESLIPALERGDCDTAMNGIEITPQQTGPSFLIMAILWKQVSRRRYFRIRKSKGPVYF